MNPKSHYRTARAFAVSLISVAIMVGVVGCSDASSGGDQSADPAKRSASTKDRGHAQFTSKGVSWNGTRATARLRDGSLSISASRSARIGDKRQRDQLQLKISDYAGQGKYEAGAGSMFVRVSIAIPEDGAEEAESNQALTDALGGASTIRMSKAAIEITSIDDGFIDGRFSLGAQAGASEAGVSEGQFHARLRE